MNSRPRKMQKTQREPKKHGAAAIEPEPQGILKPSEVKVGSNDQKTCIPG